MRGFLSDPAIGWHTRVAGLLVVLFPALYVVGSAAADAAAVLASLAFLHESRRRRDWTWLRRGWVALTFALWGYFTLRGLFAEHPSAAVFRAAAWIRYPLFGMALAFYLLRIAPVQEGLVRCLGAVLVFIMADSLFQFYVGQDVFGRLPLHSQEGSLRLTGPFGDPKVGIVLAWLGLPVVAWLACIGRLWAGAMALGIFLVVFLSGERMALLLLGFGYALLALSIRALRLPALGMGCVALVAVFLAVQADPALRARQMESVLATIQHYEASPYGQIWGSVQAMVVQHPVFGVGAKHFRLSCPDPRYGAPDTVPTRCNIHPHQLYLEWLVEGGAVGLALFLALLACLLRDALRGWRLRRADTLYLGLLIALLLRVWPLSTSTSFFAAWSALPFWLVAGWLLARACHREPEAPC